MERVTACQNCISWVDCGDKNGKPYGFCVQEDLFTFTAKSSCSNQLKGNPMTEYEYEKFNMNAEE